MSEISFHTDVLPLKNELFRLALRITQNRHDAEDIVQETMLRVWSKREQWSEIESMEAFCLTICRNLALDRQKRMDRQTSTSLDSEQHDTSDRSYASDPEEQTVQRDRLQMVFSLLTFFSSSSSVNKFLNEYKVLCRFFLKINESFCERVLIILLG